MMMKNECYKKTYPVLGIPLTVITNSEKMAALVEERYKSWESTPGELVEKVTPGIIEIYLHPERGALVNIDQLEYRVSNAHVTAEGPGIKFSVDRLNNYAEATLEPAVLSQKDYFISAVLDCMVLFLATRNNRVPLHASTIIVNGTALVLYGQSGSGKSTLSYQLYREGAGILSESAVYIQNEGGFRLWGDPQAFNLRPDSREFFPELNDLKEVKQSGNKNRIRLDIASHGAQGSRHFYFSGKTILIFLEPIGDNKSYLARLDKSEAMKKLRKEREPGYNLDNEFDPVLSSFPFKDIFTLHSGSDLSYKTGLLYKLTGGEIEHGKSSV